MEEGNVEVSVVMSVFNGESFLREAIDSILSQSFSAFEFIIINDGSTDKSIEIINSYNDGRIKLIDQTNSGLSRSLNRGIEISKSNYIARMDADDISLPTRLEKQYQFLQNNNECVVVGTNAMMMDLSGDYLYTTTLPLKWVDINAKLPTSSLFHSSTMFRKNAFIKAGGYMEEIGHHFEDKILWNKICEFGQLRNISEPLIKYRIVPTAISNRSRRVGKLMNEVFSNIMASNCISEGDLDKLKTAGSNKKSEKYATYFLRIGKIYLEKNFNRKKAFINLIKSFCLSPLSIITVSNLILCFLPKAMIMKWKRSRGA